MTIDTEIAQFLRRQALSQHIDEAHRQNLVHPLVVYAETHVGEDQKSRFFAELVRRAATTEPPVPAFHASERFDDTPPVQVELQNYVTRGGRRHLTGNLAKFQAMLDAVSTVPGHAFAVLCANNPSVGNVDPRTRAIFDAFVHSIQRHNTLQPAQITNRTHGSFLMGARHAGHASIDATSAAPTVTQLLAGMWPDVYVVRIFVDFVRTLPAPGSGLPMPGDEEATVFPLSAEAPVTDLLPIFRRHDSGRSFFAEMGGLRSVFSRLRSETTTSTPFDQMFDAILYLNDTLLGPPGPPGAP